MIFFGSCCFLGEILLVWCMEVLCELCGVVKAVVYCKADSARLCLKCDKSVHSANFLSRKHLRALICDKCHIESATIRCMDHKLSLCQVCDRNCSTQCFLLEHQRTPLNFYNNCPTLAELYQIWPHLNDASSSGCSWESSPSTLSKNNSSTSMVLEQSPNEDDPILTSNSKYFEYCKYMLELQDLDTDEGTSLFEGVNVGDFELNCKAGAENIGADFQHHELPVPAPMFLPDESLQKTLKHKNREREARAKAKMRYDEKKKIRRYGHKINYESGRRYSRGETERYDYDPRLSSANN